MRLGALFVVLAPLILLVAPQALAERRVALVIGNADYKTAVLKNPVNDARDMAKALKELGFEVTLKENAGHKEMEEAVRAFGNALKPGGLGLFYFAGHGMQVGGENYLLPVDTKVEAEADVKFGALNAGLVLARMEDAGNGLNIVILDACRNNPFGRGFRSFEPGLARMDAPKGSLVAYATAPGKVAADGDGRNGVYTASLLRHMRTQGLKVEDVLKRVRQDVVRTTAEKQVPWESSSLIGDFFFAESPGAQQAYVPAPPPAAPPAEKKDKTLGEIFSGLFKKNEPEQKPQAAAPATPPPPPPSPAPQPATEAEPTVAAPQAAAADAELEGLQEELKRQEAAAMEAKTKAQQKTAKAEKAALKKKIEAAKREKERAEAEAKTAEEAAAKVPDPQPAEASLGEIKKKAQDKAKAEAEAKKKWAAWQAEMKKAFAEAQRLEKDKELSPADKTEIWTKILTIYGEENPFSTEDNAIRRKSQSRIDYWSKHGEGLKQVEKSGQEINSSLAKNETVKTIDFAEASKLYDELIQADEKEDYTKSLYIATILSERGYGPGQFYIGMMHKQGIAVQQNSIEANKWLTSAFNSCLSGAEQGDVHSQRILAYLYWRGHGTEADESKAIKWLMQAANKNDYRSYAYLGFAYMYGIGSAKSYPDAMKMFTISSEQGVAIGQYGLGLLYFNGFGVNKNEKEGVKLIKNAAEKNITSAQVALGMAYARGKGIAINFDEAMRLFNLAAKKQFPSGYTAIGIMYYEGKGVKKNMLEAEKYFRQAADMGDDHAQFYLGFMYANGQGFIQNFTEAAKWFELSAKQGNSAAQNYLGIMYANGRGVSKNLVDAYIWFSLSASQGNEKAISARDAITREIPQTQLSNAQKIVAEWKAKKQQEFRWFL